MKTDFRSISLGFSIFFLIYGFMLTQIGYSVTGINFSIIFAYFNPKNDFYILEAALSYFDFNFLGYNFDYIQLALTYILFLPDFIINILYGIGSLIASLISLFSLPFNIFPTPIRDLFTSIIYIVFAISLITTIQVIGSSLKSD